MTSAAGQRLTQQHRQAQEGISASVAAQLDRVWPLLDPQRLEATTPRWLAAALRIVVLHHRLSVEVGRRYYAALRQIEVGSPPEDELPSPQLSLEAVTTSLMVTGPVRIRRALP